MIYTVAIEIRSTYIIDIKAKDDDEAQEIANNMQSTEIEKEGHCTNVETEFIEIENEEEDDEE